MKTITCLTTVCILAISSLVFGGHTIPYYVLSNGGGPATSANHTVHGTLGEPITGTAVSANHTVHSGFWNVVLPHCSLTADLNLDVIRNGIDVQGFTNCLLGVNGSNCDCADMNADGVVNSVDVPLFVAALMGP